jgi:RNA polymerase sigma-70 factor (ECF subfamily)
LLVRELDVAALLAGAREGKNAHIGELQRRFGPALLTAIKAAAGDRAQEVVNDTFMSLPRKLASYTDDGRFDRWLYVVAFNIARSGGRAARRYERDAPLEDAPDPSREASAVARTEEKELLTLALRVLPESEREAWLLHFEGYEPADIGEKLGISANAAAVRVHRARKRLKDQLGDG